MHASSKMEKIIQPRETRRRTLARSSVLIRLPTVTQASCIGVKCDLAADYETIGEEL
jgi:hypothetical protein